MLLRLAALFLMAVEVETIRAILQYDVTTMATNGTLNDTDCMCDCEEMEPSNTSAPSNREEAQKAADQLVSELKLDKSNLSATTRKKISAKDNRPSAQGIGAVGVLVIIFVLGSIVALDFTVLVNDVKFTITRLFGYPHGQPPYRNRVPRRIRRGLRGGPPPRNFYSSHAESAPAGGQQVHREMADMGRGGAGRRDLATGVSPSVGSDVPDLRSRREYLLMHGTGRQ